MLDLPATEALFDSTIAAVRTTRDVVEVDGPGAADYLHGQLSQNVMDLDVGSSALTLLLAPQGKIDARMRLTRQGEHRYWLDVEPGFGQAALERLERFKLRVDATITLHQFQMVALRGPDVAVLVAAGDLPEPDGGAVLDALWPGVAGVDVLGPDVSIPDGVTEGPIEALDGLRIRLGIAAMGSELTEATIPAAARVVEASVDFTKGCYVGQELVARIDSRGNNTPTRLQRLRFDTDATEVDAGASIVQGETAVGEVTSFALGSSDGAVGLGYIKRGVELPTRAEVVASDGTRLAVEIFELKGV